MIDDPVQFAQDFGKDPKFQFTSLAHLLNEGFLKECYYDLGRDRACGIDGVSWKEYGEKLDENISNLVSRLKSKRYRPLAAAPESIEVSTFATALSLTASYYEKAGFRDPSNTLAFFIILIRMDRFSHLSSCY